MSVSEQEKRPLCLRLDLHYHVLILMQFEKETDMETHWVKRGLSVLSGTACSYSPDMLPTRRSRARLRSPRQPLFIRCHCTTRFQAGIKSHGRILHQSVKSALQYIEIKHSFVAIVDHNHAELLHNFCMNLKCMHTVFSHRVPCIPCCSSVFTNSVYL